MRLLRGFALLPVGLIPHRSNAVTARRLVVPIELTGRMAGAWPDITRTTILGSPRETQWKLFSKESARRVKPLLYVYRVLLTGIWLMRTGQIEANLVTPNKTFHQAYIPNLVARKRAGPEQSTLNSH